MASSGDLFIGFLYYRGMSGRGTSRRAELDPRRPSQRRGSKRFSSALSVSLRWIPRSGRRVPIYLRAFPVSRTTLIRTTLAAAPSRAM
jgi:hypothetical protein